MKTHAGGGIRGRVPRKALIAICALGAVVSSVVVYGAASRGGVGPDSQVIAVAFRADGGSPAVAVAYGHPYDMKLELPDGDYYVQLVNGADTIMNLDKVSFSDGQRLGSAKFSGPASDQDHEHAAALRTVANFVNDVESARLDLLSSASGGFTQPLFAADVSGDDLARFYASYLALGDEEANLTAALKTLDRDMAGREAVRYVRADGAPPAGLADTLLDKTLPDFFNRMRKLPERERGRVAEIIAQMDAGEKREAFDSLPANLRGDAANFDEWQQAVQLGELDQQLGAIHGHLYVTATGATQKAGQTPGRAVAEEGGPLLESGTDLMVKAYGKVPHVGKAVDVTKKALEWEGYVRKLYNDPNAGAAGILKGPYQKLAKDRIKADLQKMMPNASPSVIDALAGQLAKRMATALAAGLNVPASAANAAGDSTPGFPPAAGPDSTNAAEAPAWVDELVNAIAQRLLADGHQGIAVAVVTDDLRVCLLGGVAANLDRNQALSACAYILERLPSATPTIEAEPSAPPVDTPPAQPTDTPVPAAPPADAPPACPTADSDGIVHTDLDGMLNCQKPAPPPPPPPPPPTAAPCQSYDPACGLAGR